jgi:2-hydroxy-6-oxonona-2,4-dienedioate hydrolase
MVGLFPTSSTTTTFVGSDDVGHEQGEEELMSTLVSDHTQASTSRHVDTATGRIHYHEAGQGQPLVLLHGSGPGATAWSNFGPNITVLAKHHRVLALDMPGWGKSPAARVRDRDHAQTLAHVLDALELDSAAVVGNSMGAVTALNFAIAFPDRVSHIVTMGAAMPGQPMMFSAGDGPSEGLRVLFATYRDPSAANMKRLVEVMTFDSTFATDELAEQRSRNALDHPQHLANFVADLDEGLPIVRTAPTLKDVMAIAAPTMLIHGRDDRVLSLEHSLRLVSSIKDARLVVLNRCGHWAQLEHADEFNRLVHGFISGS